MLNKQLPADKGWSYSLGIGRSANNFSPQNLRCCGAFHKASDLSRHFGTGAAISDLITRFITRLIAAVVV